MIQAVAKQARGGKKPSELRWDNRTADDFRGSAEMLRQLAARFDALADEMEQNRVKSVRVDGALKFKNGVDAVKDGLKCYATAVNEAVLEKM